MCLVPERRELFAAMTVADNLELGAFQRYRSRRQDHCRDARRGLPAFSATRGAARTAGGHAVGRRAADACAGAGADGQAQIADARRTQPRARAADREGDFQHHQRPQGDRRLDPAGRTERACCAAGCGPRLRPGDGGGRDRGRQRRSRRQSARRRDLPGAEGGAGSRALSTPIRVSRGDLCRRPRGPTMVLSRLFPGNP